MNKYIFTKEEKKILIELICNEQTHMIIKDHTKYESDKYKKLEELKIKVKDMWGDNIADITMCTSESCTYRDECYRVRAKPSEYQSWSNFEYTCNENSGFEDFMPVKHFGKSWNPWK